MGLRKLNLSLLGVAGVLLSSATIAAEGASHEKGCGTHGFNEETYRPPNLHSLSKVPETVRQKLELHLKDRLTASIYESLRFSVGQHIDGKEMQRIHAYQQKRYPGAAHREVPTYELCFTYPIPAAGIKSFAAGIQLREDGSVVEEIGLPAFSTSPEKQNFIKFEAAEKIALEIIKSKYGNDASISGVDVDYSQQEDSIVWAFSKTLEYKQDYFGRFWRVVVSAHDGRVLSSSESSAIY